MNKRAFVFALLGPLFLWGMTAQEKEQFWFKSLEMRLYHKRNRGNTAAAVLQQVQFKIPSPRKAPTAQFVHGGKSGKQGKLTFKKIPLVLKEEAGIARDAWVRFGLPLPEGGVFQTRNIRIVDAEGQEIPSQSVITGFWKDQSVKWALVQFSAPLKAHEEKTFYVETGSRVTAQKYSGITFTENENQVTVNTGKLTAVIDKKKFTLVRSVHRGKMHLGNFSGVVLTDDKTGHAYRLSPRPPESFEISECGPRRLTFRVAGKYWNWNGKKNTMSYVARISFFADSEAIDIQYTHLNTNIDREFTDVRSLHIEFVPSGGITGVKSPTAAEPVERIFQETDEFYSVNGGKRIGGQISSAAESVGRRKFSFGIADAWKRYPKAFSVQNKRLLVELLPRQPHGEFNRDLPYYLVYPFCDGAYRFKWGMGFTERIRFDFSGRDTGAELDRPVVAVLPKSWYRETGVFPGLDAPGFEKIDRKILNSFRQRQEQSKAQREYGYFNYGDSFGEKRVNWTNNEYDMAHGLFLTFLRTGDRAVYRAALAAARHQADVDTCRAYPDPYYVGGDFSHRGVHNGRYKMWMSRYNKYQSAANGHTWTWGMLNAWQLAGDAAVMDAALLAGDHISLAMAPNYEMGTHAAGPRECAWAMRAAGKLYEATLDPVHLNAMKHLAMKSMETAKKFENGLWLFKNKRILEERGEDVWSNVIFITGIALKGMCEYYQLSGDESVKPFIRRIADRILFAFAPEHGCGFNYDVDLHGRRLRYAITTLNFSIAPPLADAAVILKDPKLFDTARRSMAAGLLRDPGFSGKYLSEYMSFLADFLAAYSQFPPRFKMDFSDQAMLKLALYAPVNNWCWRGADPGIFKIRLLQDGKHAVHMQRWVTNYRIKGQKPDAGITVTDPSGKVLHRFPFDSTKGTMEKRFELTGKKGDVFTVTFRDHTNGDWSISPSGTFVHAGVFNAGKMIHLVRCGLNEFFFEVPAGKKAVIRYYGTHSGTFSCWVFDSSGKIIRQGKSFQAKHAISAKPANVLTFELPVSDKKQLFSAAFSAEADARLFIENAAEISGSRKYFDK